MPARTSSEISPSARASRRSAVIAAVSVGLALVGLVTCRSGPRTDAVETRPELIQVETDDTVAAPPADLRGAAAATGSSGASDYRRFRTSTGALAHWGVCDQPIPYWVDPRGGPRGFAHDIAAVLDRVSALTGYTFAYRGARPDPTYGGTGFGGIAYRWTTAATDAALHGDVVGTTRFTIDADGFLTGADVALDETDLVVRGARLSDDPSALRTDVYLHETGHALGLDHVSDRDEVMSPSAEGLTAYGPGDVAGLRAVGIGGGCRPENGLL